MLNEVEGLLSVQYYKTVLLPACLKWQQETGSAENITFHLF